MAVKRKAKPLLFIVVFFIILLLIGVGGFVGWNYLSGPVDKNDDKEIEFVVENGMTSTQIGEALEKEKLIHSKQLFKAYVKMNHVNSLKAANYLLKRSMSLEEIVKELEKGSTYNPDRIKVTFKEGLRITDYAKVIEENTNHKAEDFIKVMQDLDYAKELTKDYWFLTEDILAEGIYYPLEGYLAPDTYYFENKDVEIKEIVETLLKQTEKNLENYKTKMQEKPHYYMTMASIVELEGNNSENREMIAGVFENRLASGMNMGSDVTTYYGLQVPMTSDLTAEQFDSINGYNTRSNTMIGKMPVGPICNPGKTSISASINPTKSDYFYFVADKNGKIYFTKTMQEHQQKIAEIKANGDWIW